MIHGPHKTNYTAKLREAIYIILKVESYPEPLVSWAKSAGGKLGVWNITKFNEFSLYSSMYYLESSIQPTKEEDSGLYMAAIRNEIGSVEVYLQLHVDRMYYLYLYFVEYFILIILIIYTITMEIVIQCHSFGETLQSTRPAKQNHFTCKIVVLSRDLTTTPIFLTDPINLYFQP